MKQKQKICCNIVTFAVDFQDYKQTMGVSGKKRIEFIDLAKGVCILLIILGHCGVAVDYPGLTAMRTPLYLTLAGLFFKDYGGIKRLFIRKCNRLLIPFLFFYIASYVVFYIVNLLQPGLIVSDAKGILDLFTQNQYFNGPLWFLLDIFWSNILFYCIHANVKREPMRALAVALCSVAGYTLYKKGIFLPCFIDCSLLGLPFFYFGYILKKSNILYPTKYDRYNIPFALLLFTIAFFIDIYAHPTMFFHDKVVEGNILSMILLPLTSVIALMLLCKAMKRLPFISYFGRYSIIPLCIHHLVYRPIALVVYRMVTPDEGGSYIVAITTIIICFAAIPLFTHYLPQFTAQKEFIKEK